MEDKKWSEFFGELEKHLKTINEKFLNVTLPFDDSEILDKEGDKEIEKEKNTRENELLELLNEKDGITKLLEQQNQFLNKKNARIETLKEAFRTNKDKINNEYNTNKETCRKSWQTIKEYLDDKDGFIYFLTKAFQNQHIGDQGDLKAIKDVVEKKKNDFDCLFCCKTIGLALLVIVCIGVQVILFSKLEVCTDGSVPQDCVVWANCILVVAMIVLLVSEIFMVLGIIRLSKKKNYILQRLELILNKIEMHKVSKFEIDRDLEKVLEEMK